MKPLPVLPALKSLGKLAEMHPVILIDSRERTPLHFQRLQAVRTDPEHGLYSGDYSFRGGETYFAVERKSIPDIVACCKAGKEGKEGNREPFERELHRLRGFWFRRLLIVGTREDIEVGNYRSEILPEAVLHSLAAWEVRYSIPVVFCATPELAAAQIEEWVWWAAYEICETANELKRGTERAERELI